MTDILTGTTRMSAGPAPNNFETNTYEPRRSSRVNSNTAADGDTWEEKLVVCEASAKKLVIRSYFRNTKGKRVWDEPPTGASHIEPASAAARHDAEQELKNLQMAMDNGPDGNKKGKSKKGKGFFSAFRKKPKDGTKEKTKLFGGNKKNPKKTTTATIPEEDDMEGDEDLQRAIGASMGLEAPKKQNKKTPGGTSDGNRSQWNEDQEALDMAKAISMSEAQAGGVPPMSSEEEMLQKAIEASRTETTGQDAMPATGVASMPASIQDFLGFSGDFSEPLQPQRPSFTGHDSESSFFMKKMPARSSFQQPSPFSTLPASNMAQPYPVASLDPYNANQQQAPPVAATAAAAAPNATTLKPSPPVVAPVASLKPPPPVATSTSFDFDPYAKSPNPPPAAVSPAAAFPTYDNSYNHPMESSNGLRKMDGDDGQRKTAKGLVGRMYNKKNVQVKAGVV